MGPVGDLADPRVSYGLAPQTAGDPGGLSQIAGVSQAIPWPGVLRLRRNAARDLARSSRDRLLDVRLRLAETARTLYAEWYYVHRALQVNAENQALLVRLRNVAEAAYASGQAPQQDVLSADVERTRLQDEALVLKRRRSVIHSRINGLLDLNPSTPLGRPQDIPGGAPLAPEATLEKTALSRYPALAAFEARLQANQERIRLARKGGYPNFVFGTTYNQLMAPDKRWTVGVTINVPLNRARRRAEVDEAQAASRQTQARQAQVRARLLSDLAQSYATARQARASAELYEEHLLPLAHENLEASEADYGSGRGDFLKVITAEQQYLMAELGLARSRADAYIELAALDYQTGGAVLHTPAPADTGGFSP